MNLENLDEALANAKLTEAPYSQPKLDPILDVDFVLGVDEGIRKVVDLLRASNSLLILNPDQLERQEEEAAAELYPALSMLARAKRIEEHAAYDMKRVENLVFGELMTPYKGLPSKSQPTVTEIRHEAGLDPRCAEAHNYWLQSLEDRRRSEAYATALQLKLSLIPGCQGSRNRTM